MDAIDFIAKDIKKSQVNSKIFMVFMLGILIIPAALGIALRDEHEIVWNYQTFIFNSFAAIALALATLAVFRRETFSLALSKWSWVIFLLAMVFSVKRIFFPLTDLHTVYNTSDSFIHETWLCFQKGSWTVAAMGLWVIAFSFGFSSWPTRKLRFMSSVSAGVAGMVMLGFHCDSSSVAHVLLGHTAPGILLGVSLFFIQEILLYFKLKTAFPQLFNKIKSFSKIS